MSPHHSRQQIRMCMRARTHARRSAARLPPCRAAPRRLRVSRRRRRQVDEAITEALEADNLALQSLACQRYVALNPGFTDAVASWQRRLGGVDAVLGTWADVGRKWGALEAIFVGSADIRVQLPEDSKRFDGVNADYQVMRAAGAPHWRLACCIVVVPVACTRPA